MPRVLGGTISIPASLAKRGGDGGGAHAQSAGVAASRSVSRL
jgi:hypothetical protein